MVKRILFILCISFSLSGCSQAKSYRHSSAAPIDIHRFDKALFQMIEKKDTTLQEMLSREYPVMLDILGKAILNMRTPTLPGFYDRLIHFYSEPTLFGLYQDAINLFEDIHEIEKETGIGFAYLTEHLPGTVCPRLYMHVSGFGQNVLVGENTLSISIDKYLGFDYPLYLDFFYDSQRRKMQPDFIPQDYLTGWFMSEYPFSGNENVLLERMIYEGKLKYLLNEAFPERSLQQLMGYTEEEYQWVETNEEIIWKAMIERKHLYTPDLISTNQYFEDMPSLFLSDDAPGNIGTYIGWQIVSRYMKETKSTPEDLMKNNDAQAILAAAKYKP